LPDSSKTEAALTAGLCMLAAVWLCPALAQQTQEPAEQQLAPLLPAVTTETLAHLLGFAARDRACLKKVAGEYELTKSYEACVDGLRATTYCDADATDIADLAALIDSDRRLADLLGTVEPVIQFVSERCTKSAPSPDRELLAASARALRESCHTVMPVLIAMAVMLRGSERDPAERYGLCRSSLGITFIVRNCNEVLRAAYRRAGPPSLLLPPNALGVEPYVCPEEFVKLPFIRNR